MGFTKLLAPVAERVQAPIFKRFGLPAGQAGVMQMKVGIKLVAKRCPQLSVKANDLHKLFFLSHEEETAPTLNATIEVDFSDRVVIIENTLVDVQGPLANALQLPYGVRQTRRKFLI